MEKRPSTLNDHYLTASRLKILAALKSQRGPQPITFEDPAMYRTHMSHIKSHVAALGGPTFKEEELLALLAPPDEYEAELDLMSRASAYWKVATKVS